MEGIPNNEAVPTKEEILGRLRSEGLNEETRALITKWTIEKENEVKTARDAVLLNIERIDFYEAVGDDEATREHLKDVIDNIMQEGATDLMKQVEAYMTRYFGWDE